MNWSSYQQEVFDFVEHGSGNGLVEAVAGSGKALSLDTPIPTVDGWKTMGTIQTEDAVFRPDGLPCRVTATSEVFKDRDVWRVSNQTGDSVVADGEHEWLVWHSHRTYRPRRLMRTVDLYDRQETKYGPFGGVIRAPILPVARALRFPRADLLVHPYVLGLWLGDGSSGGSTISVGEEDRVELQQLLNIAGYELSYKEKGRYFAIPRLRSELRALGLLHDEKRKLCGYKHIPTEYMRACIEQRTALLNGLIDSDGYVPESGNIEFCSVDPLLAGQVHELVSSLGTRASIHFGRAMLYGKDCGTKYRVCFYLRGAAALSRKAKNTRDYEKYANHYLHFEHVGKADTKCIKVDSPTQEFLCGEGLMPTHNSSTIKEAVRRIPPTKSVLVLAFNRHIRDPLQRDLEDLLNVRVATLNSFGFSAVRRAFPHVRVDADKVDKTLHYEVLSGADSDVDRALYYGARRAVCRLTSLRKSLCLWDLGQSEMLDLMDYYDVQQPSVCDEEKLLTLLGAVWRISAEDTSVVDFDDQLALPILLDLPTERFDWILVDEAQDLSPVQIELCKRALRPEGRALFVGDRRQAIYQFRGADQRAIERIEEEMQCEVLPLSICYRCAAGIVRLAKSIVPQIEWAPNAPEGLVEEITLDTFEPETEDFVLCRTTAPLVEACLTQIRQGKKALVRGRDIGQALVAFCKKAKCLDGAPVEEFLEGLEKYYSDERAKLAKQHREAALQTLEDKFDTILALAGHADTLAGLLLTIEKIFSDEVNGITFSTVHKAKGLEAERVWILRPDLMPHPKARDMEAERNIRYVALTRAKRELRIVHNTRIVRNIYEPRTQEGVCQTNSGT